MTVRDKDEACVASVGMRASNEFKDMYEVIDTLVAAPSGIA